MRVDDGARARPIDGDASRDDIGYLQAISKKAGEPDSLDCEDRRLAHPFIEAIPAAG